MGKVIPVLLAYALNCAGVSIFRKSAQVCAGSFPSAMVFLSAVFIVLLDVRLYPKVFKQMSCPCVSVVEVRIHRLVNVTLGR